MPADPCMVTVKAGIPSRGYENFVSNKLQDEVLKEITSNLQEDLKEEALTAFKETVKDGWSIKDCIAKVQNEVLPKVPNERNKFFIKFTYDNQLQIEIGVNKFKNGNAQFYHKIGVAPKETPEIQEFKEERSKRQEAMKELASSGYCPSIRLKRQITNDKSAPFVSGKVSNPGGGWDDAPDNDENLPPNPTNMQTARALTGWQPATPCETRTSRPRALGDLFRKQKPNAARLRCRSVGRPQRERLEDVEENSPEIRDRSISPLGPRGRAKRGALGDCFRTGIRPTKAMLRPTGSPIIRNTNLNKMGRKDTDSDKIGNMGMTDKMMKHINIQIEKQHSGEDDEEWNENCVEIEEISSPEPMECEDDINDSVSCEQKQSIFITEADTKPSYKISQPEYMISQPIERDFKKVDTPFHEEYPIKNLRKFNVPDQSLFTKKINPLPPLEDYDGWHGPVLERTRPVPNKCFGKLEISCDMQPSEVKNTINCNSKEDIIKNIFEENKRTGWIPIPIQRL